MAKSKGINPRNCAPLAPVVVDDDYKDYLRTLGLKWDNVETWHFPYSNEGVPVAFFPVNMLIEDLNNQDSNFGKIISLLADGYKKGEVLDMVDLGKGKTQGYSFIEKAQKAARELYNKKYRD